MLNKQILSRFDEVCRPKLSVIQCIEISTDINKILNYKKTYLEKILITKLVKKQNWDI